MRSSYSQVKDISQSPQTENIKPLLFKWIECTEHYVTFTKGTDAPYWYNERASLSVLTGAAWSLGYAALDEFTTEKKKGSDDETGYGRCDAWIGNEVEEYCIEAKQLHDEVKANDLVEIANKVCDNLQLAIYDAGNLTCQGIQKVAISFFSPRIRKDEWSEEKREELIDSLSKHIPDMDMMAWCFPEAATKLASQKETYKEFVFPGTFLLLKFVE